MKRFIPHNIYTNLPQTASRLEWSELLGRKLTSSIKRWEKHANSRLSVTISEDRYQCDWTLQIDKEAPVVLFGFIFGDALHNERSALDNAVYEKAVALGVTRGLNKLEFPICAERRDWPAKLPRLQVLPASLIALIEQWQPYNLSDETLKASLLYLHNLNITDKHRVPLVSVFPLAGAQATVEATPYGHEQPHEWHWTFQHRSSKFQNGSNIMRLTSQEKLGTISGEFQVIGRVSMIDSAGRLHGATESIASMLDTAVKVISNIAAYTE